MWQFVFVAERRSVVRTELGSCVHPPPACSTSLPSWPTAAYGAGEQLGTVADRSGGRRPAGVGRSRWCAGPAGGRASCRGLALPGRWCWRRRAAASCGRTFLRQEEEASVTGSLVARPLFASVTLCRVAPCRHHQLEGPPGPVLRSPSCWALSKTRAGGPCGPCGQSLICLLSGEIS